MLQTLRQSTKKIRYESLAQVTLEFTFCFVALLLIIYGCLMVFRWSGVSFIERRIAHEKSLNAIIDENWNNYLDGPLKQINPDFYKSSETAMNFVYQQW